MKKRMLCIALSGMIMLSSAACGSAKETQDGENQTSTEIVKEENPETEEVEEEVTKAETEEPKVEEKEQKIETEEPKVETEESKAEEPKVETEEAAFEKTVVCEQDGITVTITDFKNNELYYVVKNETEKKIFVDPLKIEVNGSVIRDFMNNTKEYYLGAIAFGEKVAPGEEIEISKNLFELTEQGIKAEEIGVVFGIVEVKGDKVPEIEYNEIMNTDMITVKIPEGEGAEPIS